MPTTCRHGQSSLPGAEELRRGGCEWLSCSAQLEHRRCAGVAPMDSLWRPPWQYIANITMVRDPRTLHVTQKTPIGAQERSVGVGMAFRTSVSSVQSSGGLRTVLRWSQRPRRWIVTTNDVISPIRPFSPGSKCVYLINKHQVYAPSS